jgi:hypothetical protein
MLTDTENKKPDQHGRKAWREESDEQYSESAKQIGDKSLSSGTKEKQKRRNKDNQKTGYFPGQFQKSPLEIGDKESLVQKIIKSRINNTLGKSENKCCGQKQPEVPR